MVREILKEIAGMLQEELAANTTETWVDQEHSVLGRNTHITACKSLIRRGSSDAYYDSSEGRWLMRQRAVDETVAARNQDLAPRLPPSEPPPPGSRPPLAKGCPDPEADTGVYESQWLERLRSGGSGGRGGTEGSE